MLNTLASQEYRPLYYGELILCYTVRFYLLVFVGDFASMFISLQFSFFPVSLSDSGIRMILVSIMNWGGVPPL